MGITPKSNKIKILLLDPKNNVYNAFGAWKNGLKHSRWHNLININESIGFLKAKTMLLSSSLRRRFNRGILLLFYLDHIPSLGDTFICDVRKNYLILSPPSLVCLWSECTTEVMAKFRH